MMMVIIIIIITASNSNLVHCRGPRKELKINGVVNFLVYLFIKTLGSRWVLGWLLHGYSCRQQCHEHINKHHHSHQHPIFMLRDVMLISKGIHNNDDDDNKNNEKEIGLI